MHAAAMMPDEAMLPAGRRVWALARRSSWLRVGATLFGLLFALSLVYPSLGPVDANAIDVGNRLLPPAPFDDGAWIHPFGTDALGRDLLARSLLGMRYSLAIGVAATVLTFLGGCAVGIVAGFRGGWIGLLLMRLADAQLSIPAIVLAVTLLGVARPSLTRIVLVLALSGWPLYARVTHGLARVEHCRESVRAARLLGASDWRIMRTLVVPAIVPPLGFVALLDLARMVIFEAVLSFIGLGLQPPLPSFGNIIADGRKYLINAWWVATAPGLLLVLLLLSINMVGIAFERARGRVLEGEV